MPRRSTMPDKTTMERWRAEGLSWPQVAQRWYEESNHLVRVDSLTMHASRLGLTKAPEVSPLMPWVLERRHRYTNRAQMLRYEIKRRKGEAIPPKKASQLEYFFLERLQKGTVIKYEPNSAQGLWDVPKEWFDTDVVRDPDLVALEGTKDPGPANRAKVIARARRQAARDG